MESSIVPGQILYINFLFPHQDEPRNKYFVVVGIDHRPLLLKINSDNRYSQRNRNLCEQQFRLKPSVYDFLDRDSYLDCGTVWSILTLEEINGQLLDEPDRVIGDLSKDHCNEIVRLTTNSRSISNINKRIIRQTFMS